ncbi:diiron oxygenase [Nocardia sp. NPDC088792]|uniref:diiron oxygenase n=1 Tax=Nocardia sp. NPDC088792 TaxID=3364332 RepID=UPI0037FF97EF
MDRYRSSFQQWETRSSVRSRPRRHPAPLTATEQLYFPPELFPVLSAPALADLDHGVRQEILLHALYQYLHFTTVLEQHAVLPITSSIALGRAGLILPEAMRADAYKITTDEAWHAQFAYDFIAELGEATGVPSDALVEPRFVNDLARIRAEVDPDLRQLADLLFTTVSETLVSQLLMDIPRDERIPEPVRNVVADHAMDEGRHQTYFRQFLRELWTRLTPAERRVAGALVPRLVEAFLAPDLRSVETILHRAAVPPSRIAAALDESFPAFRSGTPLATEARVTVRLFTEVGALDDPGTQAAFTASGLLTA